jgi:hypothetical protein
MIANSKKLEWEGGSFRPNGARSGYGEEGARLAKNFTRWSSNEMILASRIFVGFNVGPEPVYTLEDLVEIVKNLRWAQTGDPSSTFIAQRGVYRHEGGEVVEEDGAQVIILNTTDMPYQEFVNQIVTLAEAIAERMKQEEVIVEIQRGGITQQVLGVGAGRMAPNVSYPYWDVITPEEYQGHQREAHKSDPRAAEEMLAQQEMEFAREYPNITRYEQTRARTARMRMNPEEGHIVIHYGVVRLADDNGWAPAVWELLGDSPPHLLTSIPRRGDDREDARASALSLAEREASHYVGDWDIELVPIEEMTQAQASDMARRYHMRHRPNVARSPQGIRALMEQLDEPELSELDRCLAQCETEEQMRRVAKRFARNSDWEATGRIAYRGRGSVGPSVETSLDTRADGREGPSIDYKLVPNEGSWNVEVKGPRGQWVPYILGVDREYAQRIVRSKILYGQRTDAPMRAVKQR